MHITQLRASSCALSEQEMQLCCAGTDRRAVLAQVGWLGRVGMADV